MDRPRIQESFKRRKLAWVIGGFVALSGVAFAIARLEPGAPSVAREQLSLGAVKEGTLERNWRPACCSRRRDDLARLEARVRSRAVRAGRPSKRTHQRPALESRSERAATPPR